MSWGFGGNGQLGDGTDGLATLPVEVQRYLPDGTLTPLSDVIDIASGNSHGVAILEDGSGVAWGMNDRGQLGDGTTVTRYAAVPIGGQ